MGKNCRIYLCAWNALFFQEDNIMNIRGGYNGEHNNNINGLVGNIGGIVSGSPNRI